jgi:ubiquinone/menaquinone biosynthesis C-methylase UbiE
MSPAIRAFDRLADRYDALCAGPIMTMMRSRTHARMARRFPPGSRILEIGCGTGLDAEFLASLGAHLVATDPSACMIDRTRERLRASDNTALLICAGADELDEHLGPATFEGIVSNFGALNCIEDLGRVAALARKRLVPGSRARR